MSNSLLQVEELTKHFPLGRGWLERVTSKRAVHAVDGVDFTVTKGETFGLVGESGSGKTTVGKLILRLIEPDAGRILFQSRDLLALDKREMRRLRCQMQIIFQDPLASLNPRMTVEDIVGENLEVHDLVKGAERKRKIVEVLESVGLTPAELFVGRYPHEFSGGQRQRIGIARALALNPMFIVADEPVSSLDVSVRSQILNLLQDLKSRFGLTYLLITHDLSVVRYLSDTIAVMYLGKIMEIAPSEELFSNPMHPYLQALISATPILDPDVARKRVMLKGEIPSAIDPPKGCRFHTRCVQKKLECERIEPVLNDVGNKHKIACLRVRN